VYPPDTPLTGAFNGQIENLTPNFSPLTIFGRGLKGAIDGMLKALPDFGTPKFWRKNKQ